MAARTLLWLLLAGLASAAPGDARFVDLFSPLRTEIAALSPDGRRLAYSVRTDDKVSVWIVDLDSPARTTVRADVAIDSQAEGYRQPEFLHTPARVLWMQWIAKERLALQTNLHFLSMRGSPEGALYGFNFDGSGASRLFDARKLGHPIRTQFAHPQSAAEIIVDCLDEHFAVDAFTGKTRTIPERVFQELKKADRTRSAAARPRLKAAEADLRQLLPGQKIKLMDDYSPAGRVLALVQDVADAGGFVVYDPATRQLWDIARRSPVVMGARTHRIEEFDLKDAAGRIYRGLVTLPQSPRIKRAPLILWVPSGAGEAGPRDYRPEIQALADMGFAVASVDGLRRGDPAAAGLSAEQAEPVHFTRVLDVLADHFPVSRSAVALFGQDAGARRALEIAAAAPGRFRCVISVLPEPPHGASHDRLKSLLRTAGAVDPVESVLIVSWPGPSHPLASFAGGRPPLPPPPYPPLVAALESVDLLKSRGVKAELAKVSDGFRGGQPAARAETFQAIEAFLTEHLYRYSVKLGEMDILGEPPAESPR